MKNPQESAQRFSTLLKKLKKRAAPAPAENGDAITVLVRSFLMWDATTTKAQTAYKRLMDHVVDFNDLRVTMAHEMVDCIGPRYPMAMERCQRLRAVLRHTYKREHTVSFERLDGMGRREIKRYLRSLDGIAPYVADRVTLMCYDAHCIPVDSRLKRALIKEGVGDESTEIADLGSWLARQVKASDATLTHQVLQTWVDRVGTSAAAAPTTRRSRASATRPAAPSTPPTARSRGS